MTFGEIARLLLVGENEFLPWCCRSDESHQLAMELKFQVVDNFFGRSGLKAVLARPIVEQLERKLSLGAYHFTGEKPNFEVIDQNV